MARRRSENVPKKLSVQILEEADNVCHYCSSPWACLVDHVRPLVQDGSVARGNLVAACDRCNHEKRGRTPAEWKEFRLKRGRPWPPPNGYNSLWEFILSFSEEDQKRIDRAVYAGDRRVWAAFTDMLNRDHKGAFGSVHDTDLEVLHAAYADERTKVLEQVSLYEAELVT